MGIQPVTRPWPMSEPIQLIVPGQRSRSGSALQSFEMYPSNLNMKTSLLQQQSSGISNSIYQQPPHHHHHQQQQQQHEYETISQLRNDVKYGLTSPRIHHSHSQSYSGIRPKSMIEQDQDFKSNYKLITQGMINGQLSITDNNNSQPASSPSCRSEPSRNDPTLRLHTVTPSCVPWLKRIKVIKRIKRGIGFGSSKTGTQFNNLPALGFHPVHGENVQLFNNGSVAKRINSFCKAVAFTDRPIKLNEKVCIRLLQVSTNWSGVLRFGLTNQDPSGLKNSLPKYVCPDLTSRPGVWAKAFSDHLVKEGMTINFHVNSSGELIYCIDGEEKGIFLTNVDVRSPLWAIIDVYGNTTAIELVDTRTQLNNSRPPSSSSGHCNNNDSPPSTHKSFMSMSSISTPMSTPPSKALMNHSYISTKSLPEPPSSPAKKPMSLSTSVLKSPPPPQSSSSNHQGSSSSSCQVTNSNNNTYMHLPVKSPHFQSQSKSPYCSSSSNNNTNNSRDFNGNPSHMMTQYHPQKQQQNSPSKTVLPVYKTPPVPKRVDDYDYIYSTKCGPSTSSSNNYVSIPSLNVHKIQDCPKYSSSDLKQQQQQPSTPTKSFPSSTSSSSEIKLECLACCERPVDSVFYSCGHMCMCMNCATCQKSKMGQCPICRANITDVIRIYT